LSGVAKYAYAVEDMVSGSSFRLEWDDVADYYTVYVKALDHEPNPGDEEPGELLYNKQASSGFNKNYLTISKSNLEDSVGKYMKVSIQGKNSNGDNTNNDNIIDSIADKVGITSDQLLILVGGTLTALVLLIIVIAAIKSKRR
jgi:hypothetical protein